VGVFNFGAFIIFNQRVANFFARDTEVVVQCGPRGRKPRAR
jgi:hypothetical protein